MSDAARGDAQHSIRRRESAGPLPACVTQELLHACRVDLTVWTVPQPPHSMWSGLHGVAYAVARRTGHDDRHALAAVLWATSDAIGTPYGGQPMVQAIHAAHERGELAAALAGTGGA